MFAYCLRIEQNIVYNMFDLKFVEELNMGKNENRQRAFEDVKEE